MKEQGKIEPHRITKPIQLLAAWLLGLIFVNGAFLLAAAQISKPVWASSVLVIASIVNVPLFLVSIFLLQTKFRPEMQEDSFYAKYLESKTGNTEREITTESVAVIRENLAKLERTVAKEVSEGGDKAELEKINWSSTTVLLNKVLGAHQKITRELSRHGIPVHETFGAGADRPKVFNIAVGKGFEVAQIRQLVEVLSNITSGWICFAHDDEVDDEYDFKVLIGAYGGYKHGLELSAIKPFLNDPDITEKELYELLGQ